MIYGLYSTKDCMIRYIGQSKSPQSRFHTHLNDKSDKPKAKWIRENKDSIRMELLAFRSEYEAIEAFNKSYPGVLFNVDCGKKKPEPTMLNLFVSKITQKEWMNDGWQQLIFCEPDVHKTMTHKLDTVRLELIKERTR